jgi:hypothetical protein
MQDLWSIVDSILYPSQKFEHPPFLNGSRYAIKKCGLEVAVSVMTSLLNFTKSVNSLKSYWGRGQRQTERRTGSMVIP